MAILFGLIGIALVISKSARLDLNKSQILISGVLILNFTYYIFRDGESSPDKWPHLAPVAIIYPMLFISLIAIVWRTTPLQAFHLSRILSIFAVFVVLISLANVGLSILETDAFSSKNEGHEFEAQFQKYLTENLTSALNNRDFYFIIIDRYPGEETLYAEYGFNNSDFYQNLSLMGFNVFTKSKSNYGKTLESVPSMLNMEHEPSAKHNGYNEEINRLWMFFKSQGFRFVYLPSCWYTTARNDNADITLNPFIITIERANWMTSPNRVFQKIMFFERTFFGAAYYHIVHRFFGMTVPSTTISGLNNRIRGDVLNDDTKFKKAKSQLSRESYRSHLLNTYDNLTSVPKIHGKKFTVSHIDRWDTVEKSELYLDKIRTVNQLTESMLREIIKESEIDPVIVLISDHGRIPDVKAIKENREIFAKYACYPNESLSEDYVEESWYNVDNIEAFYLPEGGNNSIYIGMTPVNAWRMILNYYFGTNFPRTEDSSYWKSPYGRICKVRA